MIILQVVPVGKPRMTQRDKWLNPPRPPVAMYWAFKEELTYKANLQGFTIGKIIDIIFFVPMPDSWSKKKKKEMCGKSHEQKPDTDNMVKAFCDALSAEDSKIWDKHGRKFWDYTGSIMILKNVDKSGYFSNFTHSETISQEL